MLKHSFCTKQQKEDAASEYEEALNEYINDSGTSRDNIEIERFRQIFHKAYKVLDKQKERGKSIGGLDHDAT